MGNRAIAELQGFAIKNDGDAKGAFPVGGADSRDVYVGNLESGSGLEVQQPAEQPQVLEVAVAATRTSVGNMGVEQMATLNKSVE